MRAVNRWAVDVMIGECDGRTYAEASLDDDIGNRLVGTGEARVRRGDPDVPEIGDEIAVARALTDLGRRLMDTAADDLAELTRVPTPRPADLTTGPSRRAQGPSAQTGGAPRVGRIRR